MLVQLMALGLFDYAFMRRAIFVGVLLAVIVPAIGLIVVLKRLSMTGDTLSHASLAGVSAGLVLGINPILGAILISILAALSIEGIRRRMPKYAEMATAIVMSAAVGLTGVLSGFVPNASNFNSFLFGSIVAISDFELQLVVLVSAVVLLLFATFFRELFFITLDERSARLAGVRVGLVNFLFTILTAVTVSVAARTVGALVVSSLMVVPVACAMQVAKSYKQTLIWSIGFALLFTLSGLVLSFYQSLKPGGTIVLIGVFVLLLLLGTKKLLHKQIVRSMETEES